MIPELRQALYTYLTSGANPFITALGGADNLHHRHPLNDKDYPYCIYKQGSNFRLLDSGNKIENVRVIFKVYDGSNDAVPESTVSPAVVEDIVQKLDNLLDLQQHSITISNYVFLVINRVNMIELPTESNSVQGIEVTYDIKLQIAR